MREREREREKEREKERAGGRERVLFDIYCVLCSVVSFDVVSVVLPAVLSSLLCSTIVPVFASL